MKRFLGILFALVLVFSMAGLIVPPGTVQAQLADTPWPMFHHDLQHTGRSPFTGPEVPTEKWSFTTGFYVTSSPAVDADGTIYVGSHDSKLYAINADGSLKWSFTTGGNIRSSPAIGADGTIYVGSDDDKLYAIKPDGSLKWSFTTGRYHVRSSPAIGADGTIYVGSGDDNLYAVNSDGSLKWRFTTGRPVHSSPAIEADGTIYAGSLDNNLYAINPDGSLKWSFTTPGAAVESSPTVAADGTIYSGSDNLYAINPDGSLKWSFTGVVFTSSPAIGTDGTIYVGSVDGKLYAIKPDGSLKWSFTTGARVESSPAIGADGVIYLGSGDHNLYAINPDGSLKWSLTTGEKVYSSPALGADGTIYVGSYDSKLHAIGEATGPVVDVNPLFLDQTLDPDQTSIKTLTISNVGIGNLTWNLSEDPPVNWLAGAPTFGTVASGGSQEVQVTFDSTGLAAGCYTTILSVKSNAPEEPLVQVRVTLRVVECGLADTPWPMFRHDLRHTGRSPFTGPEVPKEKWSFTTGFWVRSSPAIGADGTIYFGSFDKKFYAINPDGSLKWSFTTMGEIESSPAIGACGTIYIGSDDLYAINPDGSLKWRFDTEAGCGSSPAIGLDGTVYIGIGGSRGKFYAIDPEGSLKWTFDVGWGDFDSSPAIDAEGTVYVGHSDGGERELYAINPDGTEKWSFTTGSWVRSSPAIGADGTVYVGSGDHELYAVNSNGSLKWSFATGDFVFSSPAIGADGTIYVGSYDGKLYAINPDGTIKWSFTTGGYILSSPGIGADGTIYVGSKDHNLYAVNPDGSLKWSFNCGQLVISSPAIGADGTIYVGSWMNNKLYAIGEPDVPDIAVDPLSIDFGLVVVSSSSTPKTVTVANDGTADLIIGAISIAGPDATEFSIQNDNCSVQTLAPGASATLEIVFSPTSASGKSATLSIPSNDPDESVVEVALSGSAMQIVPATIDFDPDTLNLKSTGKVVTVYIELSEGYDVEKTDISTVMLNGVVPALAHPTEIGDYDGDGITDLMVKFDRSDVQDVLEPGNEVEIELSGELTDGTLFEGTDMIRVIAKGKK